MSTVKTAISIEADLLKQVDNLSHELNISRSQFFCLAAQEFAYQQESHRLLELLNKTYTKPQDSEEKRALKGIKKFHKKALQDEPW